MPLKDSFILGDAKDRTGNQLSFLNGNRGYRRKFVDSTAPGAASESEGRQYWKSTFLSDLDRTGQDDVSFRNNINDKKVKSITFKIRRPNASSEDDRYVKNATLQLLINPSNLSIGGSHAYDSQLAREGHVNTLWGQSQLTITGGGKSPAFATTREGLSSTAVKNKGFSRTKSLGYNHVMSLVALFKNNGYQHLSKESSKVLASDGSFRGGSSRVIHVLNDIEMHYDGNIYQGAFSSFSLTESADSPFNFEWNFDFVVSGIEGDKYDGHLNDGKAEKSGIILAIAGQDSRLVQNFNLNGVKVDVKEEWPAFSRKEDYYSKANESAKKDNPMPIKNGPPLKDDLKTTAQLDAHNKAKIDGLSNGCALLGGRDLVADFQARLENMFFDASVSHDIQIKINSGYRSDSDQQDLIDRYEKSGKSSGVLVEPSAVGFSAHAYGLAVDLTIWKNGTRSVPGKESKLIALAKSNGISWGGYFTNSDPVHFYYSPSHVGEQSTLGMLKKIQSAGECNNGGSGPKAGDGGQDTAGE